MRRKRHDAGFSFRMWFHRKSFFQGPAAFHSWPSDRNTNIGIKSFDPVATLQKRKHHHGGCEPRVRLFSSREVTNSRKISSFFSLFSTVSTSRDRKIGASVSRFRAVIRVLRADFFFFEYLTTCGRTIFARWKQWARNLFARRGRSAMLIP